MRDATQQMANSVRLSRLLAANDFAGLATLFHAFFASIPYSGTLTDIARYEGYYASVFYSYFAALGLDITVEDSSSHGRHAHHVFALVPAADGGIRKYRRALIVSAGRTRRGAGVRAGFDKLSLSRPLSEGATTYSPPQDLFFH